MEKHFLIYTNKHKDQQLAVTQQIQKYLEEHGQRVSIRVKDRDWKEESEEEEVQIPSDV